MAISPGQTIVVSDFPQSSAGAADSGKGVRLNSLGLLDYTFLDNEGLELMTAGESANPGQTATIGDGQPVTSVTGGGTGSNTGYSSTTWLSQNFAASAKAISIYSVTVNLANNLKNVTLSLYAIDGSNKPTGAALGSKNISSTNTGNNEFVFASPVTVTPSTTYAIVLQTTTTDSWVRGTTDNSGGISTDSGSTWTMDKGNFGHAVKEIQTIVGRVYKGDANRNGSSTSSFSDRFVGIFETTGSAGATCLIKVSKISRKVSGLTTGAICYLSDTEGAINSDFAGTLSRKIGLALGANAMLIKFDNP